VTESGDLGDAITVDLFTQLTRELDKDLWFLEAHLQA
jgi:starvation-inducible DNA-binding protein